jgi:hypothetical protein
MRRTAFSTYIVSFLGRKSQTREASSHGCRMGWSLRTQLGDGAGQVAFEMNGMDNHLAARTVRCRCPLKDLPREERELQHVPQKCDPEGGCCNRTWRLWQLALGNAKGEWKLKQAIRPESQKQNLPQAHLHPHPYHPRFNTRPSRAG